MSLERILGQPLRVINLGLELFATELEAEGASVVHVDWRPPGSGDPTVAALLARLEDDESEAGAETEDGDIEDESRRR